MKKTIVYKIRVFPTISETFIISNIVAAIKEGLEIKIIPDIIQDIALSSQPYLLQKYHIADKIISLKIPTKDIKRYLLAIKYLCQPVLFIYFLKYCLLKRKISLRFLFILQFYRQFRVNTIFHVHFANREKPLFDLKRIGFIKSKIIITFHGFDAHSLPTGSNLNELHRTFSEYVSHITVNSEYLKNILLTKRFSNSSISIVPIGIDFDFFHSDIYAKKKGKVFQILSIGRLTPLKGHVFGIDAIKILKERGHHIFYTIVGTGKEFNTLKQKIDVEGLNDHVRLSGSKHQNEIKQYLRNADVFLFPSTYDSKGRREGFGLVSIEAQSFGLPVIGFHSGGFPETIIEGKTGFTVRDRDIVALADKIEILIKNTTLLNQMGKEAQKHVRKSYSAKNTVNKYLELYN